MAREAPNVWPLQLHESTSRGLCQLAFLVLGILPLAFCGIWSGLNQLPAYKQWEVASWENWLSEKLDMNVEMERVERPSPSRVVFHRLSFKHRESAVEFGSVKRVDVRSGAYAAILVENPILATDQLPLVWKRIHDRLLCSPEQVDRVVDVDNFQLAVQSELEEKHLRVVHCRLTPGELEHSLVVKFFVSADRMDSLAIESDIVAGHAAAGPTLAGMQAVKPLAAELRITRDRSGGQLATNTELRTGSTALPCWLISALNPAIAQLGANASFRGQVTSVQTENDWRIDFGTPGNGENRQPVVCEFDQIDFGQLTWATNARVRGTGKMQIDSAQLSQSGLQFANGRISIQSPRASISSKLLESSQKNLGFVGSPIKVIPNGAHYFEHLAIEFRINPGTLKLAGEIVSGESATGAAQYLAYRHPQWINQPMSLSNALAVLNEVSYSGQFPTDQRLARQASVWLPVEREQIPSGERLTGHGM